MFAVYPVLEGSFQNQKYYEKYEKDHQRRRIL